MVNAPLLTHAELQNRPGELEARVEDITQRRVELEERIGLAVAVPTAVPAGELEMLRSERAALEVELEELLAGLRFLQQMKRATYRRAPSVR